MNTSSATASLDALHQAVRDEGAALLQWWSDHAVDETNGGFYGEIDSDDRPVKGAHKSLILNARLLWFFSAMASWLSSPDALGLAHRAAEYIRRYFRDGYQGGYYWMLDHKGQVVDAKKQAYGQSFVIYAFSEYYAATRDESALATAWDV